MALVAKTYVYIAKQEVQIFFRIFNACKRSHSVLLFYHNSPWLFLMCFFL